MSGSPAAAQRLSPQVRQLVSQLRHKNQLQAERVGWAGTTPEQYKTFVALRDTATTDELLRLTHHANAVVRGYAGWALADRAYPQLPRVFQRYLHQLRKVTNQHGCIVGRNRLGPELYYRVAHDCFDPAGADSLTYARQLARLDSIILYQYPRHHLVRSALRGNAANPHRYAVVRNICQRNPDGVALEALAQYRRPEDIALIRAQGNAALGAIARFPDPTFWPLLTSFDLTAYAGEANRWRAEHYLPEYYRALASYRTTEAIGFIRSLYHQGRIVQPAILAVALADTQDPVYDALLLDLWATDKLMLLPVAKRLATTQPAAAARAFAQGLLAPGPYEPQEAYSYYRLDEQVIDLMLGHLQQHDSALVSVVCRQNIQTASFTPLKMFLEYARRHQLTSCKAAIMARLQQPNSPFDTFHLAETALSFHDPSLKPELIRVLTLHRSSWDRYNWPEAFRKLFAANDIHLAASPPTPESK
ncbi:hypothetical protein [Hymenobacter jeollabukensis]|uniref:Uncharacterized protein n=1 Tax=Hymenobacter jeollabukensis TaxID=2025313 RepID=A0A5R8WP77_9BACT|nr:hypothetical protein [Hymenobacter jeollabukensis]TLM91858.1 hypothetical protein FDY95_14995 [Hymenobacter jeollabukensis]